jgi:acyl-CoA reductase-like NAD-dependent aldehyde dehydrogenase
MRSLDVWRRRSASSMIDQPKLSPDYGRVINGKNFDRLLGLLSSGSVAIGGQTDATERYIAPTVLMDVTLESPIMQEEVCRCSKLVRSRP